MWSSGRTKSVYHKLVWFGFENGEEKFEGLRGLLALGEDDEDPRDHVERVWLPVYKFEVPTGITGESWSTRSRSLLLDDKDDNHKVLLNATTRKNLEMDSDEETPFVGPLRGWSYEISACSIDANGIHADAPADSQCQQARLT
eukprot:Skav204812  [mRNA]  locus=scaffold894:261282:264461:+ [translate_table: standard]